MSATEKQARELLAMCLGERGFHCEAENVRAGEDLESYEGELQAIAQLLRWGFNNVEEHKPATLTPPEGYVLVQEAPLRHLLSDAITSVEFIAGRGQSKPLSRRLGDRAWVLIEALAQAGGKHEG